jgi:hypothetical protein
MRFYTFSNLFMSMYKKKFKIVKWRSVTYRTQMRTINRVIPMNCDRHRLGHHMD